MCGREILHGLYTIYCTSKYVKCTDCFCKDVFNNTFEAFLKFNCILLGYQLLNTQNSAHSVNCPEFELGVLSAFRVAIKNVNIYMLQNVL